MYEDWESEQYEIESVFGKRYALYSVEDLLGSLPIGEANLKFQPGLIKVYGEAQMALWQQEADWREYVLKHLQGEWGTVTPAGRDQNERALAADAGEIISSYAVRGRLDEAGAAAVTVNVITHLDGGFTQLVTSWW